MSEKRKEDEGEEVKEGGEGGPLGAHGVDKQLQSSCSEHSRVNGKPVMSKEQRQEGEMKVTRRVQREQAVGREERKGEEEEEEEAKTVS
jgi:hypothetical protein